MSINQDTTLPFGSETTVRPARQDQVDDVADALAAHPLLQQWLRTMPDGASDHAAYLHRLHASTTPEDAVLYCAHVLPTLDAVLWARRILAQIGPENHAPEGPLLSAIDAWIAQSNAANRWEVMRSVYFLQRRPPLVHLGLAVGWSGGPISPNDAILPGADQAGRAVSDAVLGAIARGETHARARNLAIARDQGEALFAARSENAAR